MAISKHYLNAALILSVLIGIIVLAVMFKPDIEIHTKMSNTVFLDPVKTYQKNVYVQVRNTYDKQDFFLENEIIKSLINKGYSIENNPEIAHYILQVNIIQAGKLNNSEMEEMLMRGYDDFAADVFLNRPIDESSGVVFVSGSFMPIPITQKNNLYYYIMMDVKISEKVDDKGTVENHTSHNMGLGISTESKAVSTNVGNRMHYQTRILSSVKRSNNNWDYLAPKLVAGLVRSITSIF